MQKTAGNRITISTVKALVSVGAFDKLHKNRIELLEMVSIFWERKKSIRSEDRLKILWLKIEDEVKKKEIVPSVDKIRELEREYFGFNFFTSSFSFEQKRAINELKFKKLIKLNLEEIGNISCKVPFVINDISIIRDRNNNEMSIIEAEDIKK